MKTRYIALLRAINVGGHSVRMDTLRSIFVGLGFDNVSSYIQSGNIFFDTNEQHKEILRKKIENHLAFKLKYTIPVCLRQVHELEDIIHKDPFKGITETADTRFAITFLTTQTKIDLPVPYTTPDGGYEVIDKTPSELFIVWHLKNGRPSNSYGFIEKKIQVQTTTRFWNTTAKILSAAHMSK